MAATEPTPSTSTLLCLRAVAILGLILSAAAAMDYVMVQTRNAEYLAGFTPAQLEFVLGLPSWVVACWAVAVWSSVFGCGLLLARRPVAVPLLGIGLLAAAVTTIHNFGISNGLEVMGSAESLFYTALILLFALGIWLFGRAMRRAGVLQ